MIRSDVKRVSVSALCCDGFANPGRSIHFETVVRAFAKIRPMPVTVVSFLARKRSFTVVFFEIRVARFRVASIYTGNQVKKKRRRTRR